MKRRLMGSVAPEHNQTHVDEWAFKIDRRNAQSPTFHGRRQKHTYQSGSVALSGRKFAFIGYFDVTRLNSINKQMNKTNF